MKIRVAHVGPDPEAPGGMPAVIGALVESPLAERFSLDVIPTWRDERPGRRLLVFAGSILSFARWCAGPGARIAHVHMAARGSMYRKALVVAVAKAMGRKVVLQVHAGAGDLEEFIAGLGPLRRAALRRGLVASDVVLSVSRTGGEALRKFAGVPFEVVPNAPPRVDARPGGLTDSGDRVEVLYMGGFADPAKGGAVLLEALPALLERSERIEVSMAGPGEAPELVSGRVRWSGFLDPAAKKLALERVDLFVMPSISEGMPVALLEAMAHGLPIVASRVGAVPEVLTDGVDAVLVDPGDTHALVEAVSALAEDPDRRASLGAAAAERARLLADEGVYGTLERIYVGALR